MNKKLIIIMSVFVLLIVVGVVYIISKGGKSNDNAATQKSSEIIHYTLDTEGDCVDGVNELYIKAADDSYKKAADLVASKEKYQNAMTFVYVYSNERTTTDNLYKEKSDAYYEYRLEKCSGEGNKGYLNAHPSAPQ